MILSCKNICKSFGVDEIIKNISFHMDQGEKAALIGVNGAGKTTLFKIITGELPPDQGEVSLPMGVSLGYMSQMLDLDSGNTVYEELLSVFSHLIAIEQEQLSLSEKIAALQGEALDEAMDKYSRLSEEFEAKNGYEYKSRVRGVLNGLSLSELKDMKTGILSGGQKTRVSLGKLLLTAPDILLLDEPTNHLDIDSIQWLEDFLRSYQKAVLVISHDRYFLDKIVTKIIEIENKAALIYNGNYSYFAGKKEIDRQIALKHYVDQQKLIKKQEDSIRLLKSFNREKSIRRAESKEKQLKKIERIHRPEALPDTMRIELAPRIKSGDDVLNVELLSKSFGDSLLFENVTFEIKRGDKAALIGPNGIGKTTLFRILLDNLPYNGGGFKMGHNVITGYYDQHMDDLNPDKTIFDEISDAYPKMTAGEIRNTLAAFVFTGDDVFKKIGSLSGGERGRVSLAKIMLSGANFLLLDEPTNHLDMQSKEILEQALEGYTGTLLYISHDRYFINSTANKVLELSKTGMVTFMGDYDYYADKKKENADFLETEPAKPAAKEQWSKMKQEDAKARKAKNRLKALKKEIEELEAEIDGFSAKLELSEINTDPEQSAKMFMAKQACEEKLLTLYEELEAYGSE